MTREQEKNLCRNFFGLLYYIGLIIILFMFGWGILLAVWFLSSVLYANSQPTNTPTRGDYLRI